jgi:anti-sigma regulatory factor (Ser/Thr protein kinase)
VIAAAALSTSLPATELTHRALLYRGIGEFLTLTAREVHGALAAERPVLVALPTEHLTLLKDTLDREGEQVHWVDMTEAGRNPGRILPGVLTAFDDAHADSAVFMVGEPIWPGRSAPEYDAALAHEALINLAFEDRPVTVLCPYDVEGLSAEAVRDASRTHPEVVDRRGTRASDSYAEPVDVVAEVSGRLTEPPPHSVVLQVNRVDDLLATRHLLRTQAHLAGLSIERAERFTLAGHEAIANALRHGGGRADIGLWREGDTLVCDVRSPGGFGDLLAGRRAAAPGAESGRGLLLINEICDLVQLSATPSGATVRMRLSVG